MRHTAYWHRAANRYSHLGTLLMHEIRITQLRNYAIALRQPLFWVDFCTCAQHNMEICCWGRLDVKRGACNSIQFVWRSFPKYSPFPSHETQPIHAVHHASHPTIHPSQSDAIARAARNVAVIKYFQFARIYFWHGRDPILYFAAQREARLHCTLYNKYTHDSN